MYRGCYIIVTKQAEWMLHHCHNNMYSNQLLYFTQIDQEQ
jgi:hypothetical protein